MSDANENITNQSDDEPRSDAITNEPSPSAYSYEPEQFAPPSLKRKTWLFLPPGVAIVVVLFCLLGSAIALLIPGLAKVRGTSARGQSFNNVKVMTIGMNNVASNNNVGGIPPAYGAFPVGSTTNQSFFVSLLPYIEQSDLFTDWTNNTNTPVKTYFAPADPYNSGTNSLISYGSNATLLTVGGQPTLPKSFNGRTSGVIVVFERTAKSGATWSSSNSYLADSNGSSSPEFTGPNSWSSYGTRATALVSSGCVVGMGDGSARIVNRSNASAGWAWAMDPSINSGQPAGW